MNARRSTLVLSVAVLMAGAYSTAEADGLKVQLRSQVETSENSGRFHTVVKDEVWNPRETAVIVCDVWDLHHCLNAVRRAEEFAPRLNQVVNAAREQGMTIIHAPSDCMDAYRTHPARLRAANAPAAENHPPEIDSWCSRIEAEERAVYPIDQSDGGEDDDPAEHAQWAAKLKAMGRNPGTPWKQQSELITIDAERDYISDRGREVWNVLEQRGIKNVILTGVHTNMCVLGRPFGLRQMVRGGKNTVLMRDMTDTMYNPARWPYVSHFTGTDLIIAHIERHVCPTLTSDQFLGGKPFRFKNDTRPHLAIVIAEDEYKTERTLPAFASRTLGKAFRVSYVFGSEAERNNIPGLEVLDEADVALFSVRRRILPADQMAAVRRFVAAGKPVIGIRTASHAFSVRTPAPSGELQDWPEWDAQVFGGNYHNHYGNNLPTTVTVNETAADHPILTGVPTEPFASGGSLYKASPLKAGAVPLAFGSVPEHPAEPVAWTFTRDDGGQSFYTSLGHEEDFERPEFQRLLLNGIYWSAGLEPPDAMNFPTRRADFERHWTLMSVPGDWAAESNGVLKNYDGTAWYRCVIRTPAAWTGRTPTLVLPGSKEQFQAWWNGNPLPVKTAEAARVEFTIPADAVEAADANLLVVRAARVTGISAAPVVAVGGGSISLKGRWQFRIGDDAAWSNTPLPAKFAASTDIVFGK